MTSLESLQWSSSSFVRPFLAGAFAGMAVDISLYPIDTIKTRLQSPKGFWNSGGFARIYSGIGSTISGSAPGAALFFLTYESSKNITSSLLPDQRYEHFRYMISAGFGETMACLVRVPVEVVKQRAQTYHSTSLTVFRETIANGGLRSLYRGYGITILREIPFSLIQFPLWEYLKIQYIKWDHSNTKIQPYQSMICGSVAGAVAAFITTPLDVAKTNIMLAGFRDSNQNINISMNYYQTIRDIYRRNGIDGLFAGTVPRVLWISIGGAIFLGGYEKVLSILQ